MVHSVLAVFISKEPRPDRTGRRRGINISGVDFWHAVEFSRNGRFLCTHPILSGFPPGASLRSCVSNLTRSVFRSVSGRNSFPVAVGGLLPIRSPCGSLSAGPTLSEVFDRSYRPLFPIHRGGLTRGSRPRGTDRCSLSPGACPPLGNCSNLPPHKLRVNGSRGNDDDTNSPTGVDAHQAAVGTVALRSCSSTSPVSPARAARPPRT
jgi:hypothetical protein